MGYWATDKSGALFANDEGNVWGDAPADVLDKAIADVAEVFRQDMGRNPTKDELRAGLEFALGAFDTLVEPKEVDA